MLRARYANTLNCLKSPSELAALKENGYSLFEEKVRENNVRTANSSRASALSRNSVRQSPAVVTAEGRNSSLSNNNNEEKEEEADSPQFFNNLDQDEVVKETIQRRLSGQSEQSMTKSEESSIKAPESPVGGEVDQQATKSENDTQRFEMGQERSDSSLSKTNNEAVETITERESSAKIKETDKGSRISSAQSNHAPSVKIQHPTQHESNSTEIENENNVDEVHETNTSDSRRQSVKSGAGHEESERITSARNEKSIGRESRTSTSNSDRAPSAKNANPSQAEASTHEAPQQSTIVEIHETDPGIKQTNSQASSRRESVKSVSGQGNVERILSGHSERSVISNNEAVLPQPEKYHDTENVGGERLEETGESDGRQSAKSTRSIKSQQIASSHGTVTSENHGEENDGRSSARSSHSVNIDKGVKSERLASALSRHSAKQAEVDGRLSAKSVRSVNQGERRASAASQRSIGSRVSVASARSEKDLQTMEREASAKRSDAATPIIRQVSSSGTRPASVRSQRLVAQNEKENPTDQNKSRTSSRAEKVLSRPGTANVHSTASSTRQSTPVGPQLTSAVVHHAAGAVCTFV